MTPTTVSCFIAALGCQARIEAMKIANTQRAMGGEPPAYNEDAFNYEVAELGRLSIAVLNQ